MHTPIILTIGGSDSCSGAGIQADLRTATTLGVYALSCLTAITAQNPQSISQFEAVSARMLKEQLAQVVGYYNPQVVKISLVPTLELSDIISATITKLRPRQVVLDPILRSTSGMQFVKQHQIHEKLLQLATLVTPNLEEAGILLDLEIDHEENQADAARQLGEKYNCSVLLKGGHAIGNPVDAFYSNGRVDQFRSERVPGVNSHGSGCTLATAAACFMAQGHQIADAVTMAKKYIETCFTQACSIKGGGLVLNQFAAGRLFQNA